MFSFSRSLSSCFAPLLAALALAAAGCSLPYDEDDNQVADDDTTAQDDDTTPTPDDDATADDDVTADDDDTTAGDDDTTPKPDDDTSPPGDDDATSDDDSASDDDTTPTPEECWASPFTNGDWGRTIDWATATTSPGNWGGGLDWVDIDEVVLATTNSSDPLSSFVASNNWGDWCQADAGSQGNWYLPASGVPRPDNLNNGLVVILQPDYKVVEVGMFDACSGFTGGWVLPDGASSSKPDVCQTDGFYYGAHGGGHLTAFGGLIRKGQLIGLILIEGPIGIEVDWSHLYYSTAEADGNAGFRWPANSADSYAAHGWYGDDGDGTYSGTNPEIQMGSLLALPPSFDCSVTTTVPSGIICAALKKYGAVVKDDSGGRDEVAFPVEYGVREEVEATYGFDLHNAGGDYAADVESMMGSIVIVTNPETAWPRP